jgi:hypothetical protein
MAVHSQLTACIASEVAAMIEGAMRPLRASRGRLSGGAPLPREGGSFALSWLSAKAQGSSEPARGESRDCMYRRGRVLLL